MVLEDVTELYVPFAAGIPASEIVTLVDTAPAITLELK